jgi:hypothetical protein
LGRRPDSGGLVVGQAPFPVTNLWHIFAVLVNVAFVLDEFVFKLLIEVGNLGSRLRQALDR